MGQISREAEKALPDVFFFTGQIILEMWLLYGVLSILRGQSIITKTKIGDG
jgi:hypothetical protein